MMPTFFDTFSDVWQFMVLNITVIKDIVTTLSAGTVAYVAVLGLRAWRIQLRGRTEYELARRILTAVYKLRNAIELVRNPVLLSTEIDRSVKEAKFDVEASDPDFERKSTAAVLQRRWHSVTAALVDLELGALEAEATWGEKARKSYIRCKAASHFFP